jgi:hypothetical protein
MPRVEKTVCLTCRHYQERDRQGIVVPVRGRTAGRPPADPSSLRRECTWYNTVGRDADSASRVLVMTAEVNGGRDCPVAEAS